MQQNKEQTPNQSNNSNILIYSCEIEKAQQKYNCFLFDMGNNNLKILLEENNDNCLSNIFNIILNLEELKSLHNYFLKFNSYDEVILDIKKLFRNNLVEIDEIKEEEIIIKFNLENNPLDISLNKINLTEKEELILIRLNLNKKDKEIISLKNKITNLEAKIEDLTKKIDSLQQNPNEQIQQKQNSLILENSNIFNSKKELKFLLNSIMPKEGYKKLSLKLLYDSEIEGENKEKFISSYTNKNDILILIQTTKNKIFGGYTHEAFKISEGFIKKDSNAFLFNLSKFSIYKFKKGGSGYTIWNNEGNSMDFGGGIDLRIYHKFLTHKNYTSQTSFDFDYAGEQFPLNGEKFFAIKYLELYQVFLN